MTYELWETRSGNLMGFYDSESEALGVVRRGVEARGVDSVLSVALVREDRRGRSRTIAMGADLAQRAQGLFIRVTGELSSRA